MIQTLKSLPERLTTLFLKSWSSTDDSCIYIFMNVEAASPATSHNASIGIRVLQLEMHIVSQLLHPTACRFFIAVHVFQTLEQKCQNRRRCGSRDYNPECNMIWRIPSHFGCRFLALGYQAGLRSDGCRNQERLQPRPFEAHWCPGRSCYRIAQSSSTWCIYLLWYQPNKINEKNEQYSTGTISCR